MFALIEKFIIMFKEYLLLLLLLIISLILISVNDTEAIRKLRALALGGYAVIHSSVDSFGESFSDESELAEQKKINAELMLKLSLLRDYRKENDQLKALLGIIPDYSYPLIQAKVISRLVNKAQGTYIVNRGRNAGVLSGMPCINEKGLVGLVVDVTNDFATVRTLHNNNLRISVENRRSGITGILYWDGNKSVLKNIPSNYDILPGDELITSEFSTIFPPSVSVGVVKDIDNTVSGMLRDIDVILNNNRYDLKHLYVMEIVPDNQVDSLEFNLYR